MFGITDARCNHEVHGGHTYGTKRIQY